MSLKCRLAEIIEFQAMVSSKVVTWSLEKRIPRGFPAMLKDSEFSFAKEITTIDQWKLPKVRELSVGKESNSLSQLRSSQLAQSAE